jgi:hypothetical protein
MYPARNSVKFSACCSMDELKFEAAKSAKCAIGKKQRAPLLGVLGGVLALRTTPIHTGSRHHVLGSFKTPNTSAVFLAWPYEHDESQLKGHVDGLSQSDDGREGKMV